MTVYGKIKRMLCVELEKIAEENKLTTESLDEIEKLTHSIKSIETINALNESTSNGQYTEYVNKMKELAAEAPLEIRTNVLKFIHGLEYDHTE